ncbi:MAG: prepilin-type N-terminal cleavage/methylation domain-containing protein, partial [Elusimicrobia bacterium]|nr:prepilin-type N-terminal cleavage/methylation domain-containing protein [Elusimicrobiota bacterium]
MIKNNKGFSIMELAVVAIIVAIMLVIGHAGNRRFVNLTRMQEGRSAIEDIVDRQRMHYANTGRFIAPISSTQLHEALGIDLRRNRYFRNFTVTQPAAFGLVVEVTGAAGTPVSGLVVRGVFDAM